MQEPNDRRQRMTVQHDSEVLLIRKALSSLINKKSLPMDEQFAAIQLYKKVNIAYKKRV